MDNPASFDRQHAIEGALLGTAVGDAIGLPYEGLSRRRASRLLGLPDRHRFLFGRGMVSDDTEHSCMVLQALVASGDDEEAFARHLAGRLRFWLVGLPAGIGLATLRATLRLCVGVPPRHSGVFSAGNGPAMRSAVLGAAINDMDLLRPREWLDNLCEWPRTTRWMQRLARQVAQSRSEESLLRPLRLPVHGVLPRNLLFLIVVLLHALRRLLPPY